jgi:murein DD-endopeptidase MepM/ murein hydrolase activator NlpD
MLLLGLLLGWPASHAADPATGLQLSTVPATVYKNPDGQKQDTESWYFNLVVTDANRREGLRPVNAVFELYSGNVLRESQRLPGTTLELMKKTSYRILPDTSPISLRRRHPLDEAFDFRLEFPAKPRKWGVDRVRISLVLDVPGSTQATTTLDVPVQTYRPKTRLRFPLRDPAIVTQGQINNGGHSGHSNQFAIDVMGLNAEYGPMLGTGSGNAAFAGWGREILAPADGTVVYARNDVPDNLPDGNPEETYSSLPEPILAVAGNCVVIDHGGGEFSALMHMQQGSVAVSPGAKVRAGQGIGRMGSSGDAFGVHLHYQLQDGPELFRASSLPLEFVDLEGVELSRGQYFEAR